MLPPLAEQVLALFFEAGAARFFAGEAPVAHYKRGRHAPLKFTHPPTIPSPSKPTCCKCAGELPARSTTDATSTGGADDTTASDTEPARVCGACANTTDAATTGTTAASTPAAGAGGDEQDDTAFYDDDDDPFESNAAFISLYSAPHGRAWADLTYDEAKDLATRARSFHEAPAARDPLAEPTDDMDYVPDDPLDTLMADADDTAPVMRAHTV